MPQTPQGLIRQWSNGAGQAKAQMSDYGKTAATVLSGAAQGNGTLQVGIVVAGASALGGKIGAGIVVDGNGSAGFYSEMGGTVGPKADVNAMVTAQVTNANSILDLNGPLLMQVLARARLLEHLLTFQQHRHVMDHRLWVSVCRLVLRRAEAALLEVHRRR